MGSSLAGLLSAFSDAVSPLINFLIWIFPFKIYKIHDGEKGLVLSFGKVRRKKHDIAPGICTVFMFEEVMVEQAVGRYLDLTEQALMIKQKDIVIINGCVEFSITDLKKALLEIESIEDIVESICMDGIREYARDRSLLEILDSDKITKELSVKVNRKLKNYGARVNTFMITDLRPHEVTVMCKTIKESVIILKETIKDLKK